jgi:hypothetical protein
MTKRPDTDSQSPSDQTTSPRPKNTDSYIRSTDGARMIAIEPGSYVNETIWKVLGAVR